MTRVQLRLRGAAEQSFNEVVDFLKADMKEVVLDALALLHFAIQEVREGRKIGSLDPLTREFRGVALFSLNAAAKHADKRHQAASVHAVAAQASHT